MLLVIILAEVAVIIIKIRHDKKYKASSFILPFLAVRIIPNNAWVFIIILIVIAVLLAAYITYLFLKGKTDKIYAFLKGKKVNKG